MDNSSIQVTLIPYERENPGAAYNLDQILFDLDSQIELLTSQADQTDYFISIASGLLCGTLDILWAGDFDLARGRSVASDKIDELVKRTAKMLGCKKEDLSSCVKYLEDKFPIPSDGNTPDFGGGLQHHLRDFAHHPTPAGLIFSLLTQFTCKAYGTDSHGKFLIVDVPKKSQVFIGEDLPQKIFYGTILWFFHLVSDMAGSHSSAGLSGGTGIPGPLLALAKEISALPLFRSGPLPALLSNLFNGTFLAQRDETGQIIRESLLKWDLRGELGTAVELGRQAIPVIANECMVRAFYFIRRFAMEIQEHSLHSIQDIKQISWEKVRPTNNPTITRMLVVAASVFTTVDVSAAVISQKYWVAVNYVGVGRLAVAIGQDVAWCLKSRNVKKIRQMYEEIKRSVYTREKDRVYERIGADMADMDKLGLTLSQTEILYNLEYYKTLHDIRQTKLLVRGENIQQLKTEWLEEWKTYITQGFSSFSQVENSQIHWYSLGELLEKIRENEPSGAWFRLVLLEAMLFEPYYPLSLEKDKKGNVIPSKKYKSLHNVVWGYSKEKGDRYLDSLFPESYYPEGYINRLRTCYKKVLRELKEVLKTAITSLSITAVITIAAIALAGAFASSIAVLLVGSNFTGLSGAALTSACLAYLGGGAVAAGGTGMAGGTIAIVGGGAVLGLGVGTGIGGAVGIAGLSGKKNTILQSAKLLVAVREVFLNDQHDLAYSNTIYEKYVENIAKIEKGLVELKLREDVAKGKEKQKLNAQIKKAEETVEAMKIARKSMNRFISSFETGMNL